ncbi:MULTISPECIES: hypothetical protein [unclassified Psychrobacillus]|uniref:hypothetical protein n=1 Tax=unclassified Psychrobacillus TaxID=2636677 RepID=UPI0030FB1FE6
MRHKKELIAWIIQEEPGITKERLNVYMYFLNTYHESLTSHPLVDEATGQVARYEGELESMRLRLIRHFIRHHIEAMECVSTEVLFARKSIRERHMQNEKVLVLT